MHVGVRYLDGMPEDAVQDFAAAVSHPDLDLRLSSAAPQVSNSVEWLAPTAVVIYLARPYFDGFLKEMGKDHYLTLSAGIKALGKRLLGRRAPKCTLVRAGGTTSTGDTYSITFSIVAEADELHTIKLLIPIGVGDGEISDAIDAFMNLIADERDLEATIEESNRMTFASRAVLVVFDSATARIQVVDPMKRQRRHV
jgi:hypothetical protein